MSNPVNWNDLEWEQVSENITRKVIHGRNTTLVRVLFNPGEKAVSHSHPHEQFTQVISGKALFYLGNRELRLSAGDVLHIPSGMEHGAEVLGDEPLELVDIFTPVRADFPASFLKSR